jgi:hypothetical protein
MQQISNAQINLVSSNGTLQFNNANTLTGVANITYNVVASMMSVDANVRVANSNMLLFGGAQANGQSNSRFAVTYNAAAVSLDFMVYPS